MADTAADTAYDLDEGQADAPVLSPGVRLKASRSLPDIDDLLRRFADDPNLSAGAKQALARLPQDGLSNDAFAQAWAERGKTGAAPLIEAPLQEIASVEGLALSELDADGTERVFVDPDMAELWDAEEALGAFDLSADYRLSRYAVVRPHGGGWRLESPLGRLKIDLAQGGDVSLVAALTAPTRGLAVKEAMTQASTALLLPSLLMGGLLIRADAYEGEAGPDHDMVHWDYHDLLFHSRSRSGRHNLPLGRTYHGEGKAPAPQARSNAAERYDIALAKADLDSAMTSDPPFAQVMEARRTRREFGDPALCVEQLGLFLHRTCAVREASKDGAGLPIAKKPCPSGGGIHELEIYPVVHQCTGLAPGLYHYDAHAHRLGFIRPMDDDVEDVLRAAASAMLIEDLPQIVFVIAARFDKVYWKYQSMAYSVILKNAGALIQTMYLNAEVMGLAACANGSGDADLFADISGQPYLREGSVAEFALGSRPA